MNNLADWILYLLLIKSLLDGYSVHVPMPCTIKRVKVAPYRFVTDKGRFCFSYARELQILQLPYFSVKIYVIVPAFLEL